MRAAVGGHTSRAQPRGSRDLARELQVERQIGVAANHAEPVPRQTRALAGHGRRRTNVESDAALLNLDRKVEPLDGLADPQLPADHDATLAGGDGLCSEDDLRVVFDLEEVLRAQVLVALGVSGVKTPRVNRESTVGAVTLDEKTSSETVE